MTDPVSTATQDNGLIELRLALVCYGGVSLAIYMHGVTKELEKLVRASRALEEHPDRKPDGSEKAYWEALAQRRQERGNVRTRVVIDVIAGTSAGGINGIFLAKALAHDLSQESLANLWFEKGDVKKLGGGALRIPFKLGRIALSFLPKITAKAPLDGDRMYRWLLEALDEMDAGGAGGSLMPADHLLELFVTTTDYYGARQWLSLDDPPFARERRHRHVLPFGFQAGGHADDFGAADNPLLAFSARATSSFPGAFPPIDLENMADNLRKIGRTAPDFAAVEKRFFRPYTLLGEKPGNTSFIDGGALDNYPFDHAIAAIERRPAASQVERRLLYIQPDPGAELEAASGDPPGFAGTVWGGLSKISGSQPILDNLLRIRLRNQRIERIRAITDHAFGQVSRLLDRVQAGLGSGGVMPDMTLEEVQTVRDKVHAEARDQAGYLFDAYVQVKVHATVEQLARAVCRLCRFEDDSDQCELVWQVVHHWARARGLFAGSEPGDGANPASSAESPQVQFLQNFDLGYSQRRLRFLIQGLNELYPLLGEQEVSRPRREALDRAKETLYREMGLLGSAIEGEALDQGSLAAVQALFPIDLIDHDRRLADQARAFELAHRADLDALLDQVRRVIASQTQGLSHRLYQEFRAQTADWRDDARRMVVVRYVGFPFWDALIYPLARLSDLGEMELVEVFRVSPVDARGVDPREKPDAGKPPSSDDFRNKLEGIGLGHFKAFFDRDFRENDYLWGRLDGADRLLRLLLGRDDPALRKMAQRAILDEEASRLGSKTRKTIARLRALVM